MAVVGALSAYKFSDGFGRRGAFIISSLFFIIGIIITILTSNMIIILFGRCIMGIGVGFGLAIDPLYISEMSPPEFRGQLVTWSETSTNIGD